MLKAYTQYQKRIESFLNFVFEKKLKSSALSFHDLESPLIAAMRYSVLNGGKRVRPILVYSLGEALKLKPQLLDGAAAAVELIHAYSLIHDDLPAMDDDDMRRGQPSCHRAYDEATAILAGDALQALAFEVLSDPEFNPVASETQIKMIQILSKAIGGVGMVGGQALDMAAEVELLGTSVPMISLETLKTIHHKKTGALMEASIMLPAVLADVSLKHLPIFKSFAENLGLAFQVQDDILDIEGDIADLGKTPGNDLRNNKATFVSVLGLDAAKSFTKNLIDNANISLEKIKNVLQITEEASTRIFQLTEIMIQRKS